METKKLVVGAVALVIFAVGGLALLSRYGGETPVSGDTKLDGFASCLVDKGVKFYGAFWCPHCQEQKAMFGASVKKLPYIECSLPSGQGQTQICIDEKIESYPTWVFPDGSRMAQVMQLADLAAKSGCTLPQ